MTSPAQWAEAATSKADEKDLPLVVLGGANDDFGDAVELADALRDGGQRFLHANHMQCLPRAVYVIAVGDERYADYVFERGSVVVDPHGVTRDSPGVVAMRPAVPVEDI